MKPSYKIIMSLMALSGLVGCATGLDFNQVVSNAAQFHPKVAVILPITMPSHVKPQAAMISTALTNAIADTKKFNKVIDPSIVLAQMGENKQLQDVITAYLSKMQASGVSEKELSAKIAEVFHADTFFLIEISKIGYGLTGAGSPLDQATKTRGSRANYAAVFMHVRMVDGVSGAVIWRANHSGKQTYLYTRPKLQDVAAWLMEYMLKYLPTS